MPRWDKDICDSQVIKRLYNQSLAMRTTTNTGKIKKISRKVTKCRSPLTRKFFSENYLGSIERLL